MQRLRTFPSLRELYLIGPPALSDQQAARALPGVGILRNDLVDEWTPGQLESVHAIDNVNASVEVVEKFVVRVTLLGQPITDDVLIHLQNFPKLEHLVLNDTRITGKGLNDLRQVPSLRSLELNRYSGTTGDLAQLSGVIQLTSLEIRNVEITDAALAGFDQLCNLNVLDLGAGITDAGLAHLSGLANLTVFNILEAATGKRLRTKRQWREWWERGTLKSESP
jgi:hypothetical protein